ncbi:acyltransferase [Burkholderia sp. Ax-1719]|uniref:acyltransferase family protein n=1 Tax=Burkholderia sp. Ax-1719 TaxID=2608334 RepID=UPI0014239322|nr:acyltransferase [Burkholderia sp. Ax-1719]NIE63988.1 acyltransferase [Burkholderia sp. Ax-1719]
MYKSLQACRAGAALLVTLFHLSAQYALPKYFGYSLPGKIWGFGGAGVEFFFVLSGFIIVTAHRNDLFKPDRFAAYARKRIIRIYPTYWIVFGVVSVSLAASSTLRATLPDAATLARSLLLLPQDQSVVGGTGAPVVIVAWSLQWEIAFYALMGCFILGRIYAAAAVLLLALAWGTCLNQTCTFPAAFFAQHYVALFALGALTALVNRALTGLRFPMGVAVLGMIAFVSIGAATDLGIVARAAGSSLGYGLASCAIILGLVKAEDRGAIFGANRGVQVLGDASYALYLLHFPMISVLSKVAVKAGLTGVVGATAAYFAILAACIATAVLFHLKIEKPLLRILSKRPRLAVDVALTQQR